MMDGTNQNQNTQTSPVPATKKTAKKKTKNPVNKKSPLGMMDGTNQNQNTQTSPVPATKKTAKKKTKNPVNKKSPLGDGEFIPGKTKCRIPGCGHIVLVKNTKTIPYGDGKHTVIERSVKCQGPRRHTYTHRTIKKSK